MAKTVNCKNCGAPAKGQFCDYCGTPLFSTGDAVNGAHGKRCHIWYENDDGAVMCFDMMLERVESNRSCDMVYAVSGPYIPIFNPTEVTLEGTLLDVDKDDWGDFLAWRGGAR